MAVTDEELQRAEERAESLRNSGHAVKARYDRHRRRVVVTLNTGVEVTFPTRLAEGLSVAAPESLEQIEITPSGLGLHWPKLDADLYVPALLNGVLGSKSWMARMLGQQGGRARSSAKSAAARLNGRHGGRPKKAAAGC